MNITRLNYPQSLNFIKKTISSSHFISLDLEMSGIVSDQQTNPTLTDSVHFRQTIPQSYNNATVKQKNVYKNSSHYKSVYVAIGSNRQPTTKNDFDFNKLFYEHVPFISNLQHKLIKQRNQLNELTKQILKLDLVYSPAIKAFLNINFNKIQKWIEMFSNSQTKDENHEILIDIQYMKYKAYQVLIEEVQRKYPSIQLEFEFDSHEIYKRKSLRIRKKQPHTTVISQQNKKKDLFSQDQPVDLPLMNQILNVMVENKLPLIVHNGFLDLLHLSNRFFEPLPLSWQQFALSLQRSFPKIYDTKFICNNYPTIFQTVGRQTSLQNCYSKLKEDYEYKQDKENYYNIEIDENFKEYSFEYQASHEAGFDALMTGYVFFRAMNLLSKYQNIPYRKTVIILNLPFFPYQTQFIAQSCNFIFYFQKIPLGSIRTPLNLEEKIDFYSLHGHTSFQFMSILQIKSIAEEEIVDFFRMKFNAAVNFHWKNEQKNLFIVTFIDKQKEEMFVKELFDKQDLIGLVVIGNEKYLVKEGKFIDKFTDKGSAHVI